MRNTGGRWRVVSKSTVHMNEQTIAEVGPWKVCTNAGFLGSPKDDATLMAASKDLLNALEISLGLLDMMDYRPDDVEALEYDGIKDLVKKLRGRL